MPGRTQPVRFVGGVRDGQTIRIHMPLTEEVRFEEPHGARALGLIRFSRYRLRREPGRAEWYELIEEGVQAAPGGQR